MNSMDPASETQHEYSPSLIPGMSSATKADYAGLVNSATKVQAYPDIVTIEVLPRLLSEAYATPFNWRRA